jgi:hypothetical protein
MISICVQENQDQTNRAYVASQYFKSKQFSSTVSLAAKKKKKTLSLFAHDSNYELH